MNIRFKTLSYYPYSVDGKLRFDKEYDLDGYVQLLFIEQITQEKFEDVVIFIYDEKIHSIYAKRGE